jgi:hypothetical protein
MENIHKADTTEVKVHIEEQKERQEQRKNKHAEKKP